MHSLRQCIEQIVRMILVIPLITILLAPFSCVLNKTYTLQDVIKQGKDATVLITAYNDDKIVGTGSGFFIEGNIVITNRHVIEGANELTIQSASGRSYRPTGQIIEDATIDLVKIFVDPQGKRANFLQVEMDSVSEGENIVVIGSPLGLEGTVSEGIVSAIRDYPQIGKIIQITAPISPGSSGSPVLSMNAKVIGVATMYIKGGQNLNFAIPIEKIHQLKGKPSSLLSLYRDVLLQKARAYLDTAEIALEYGKKNSLPAWKNTHRIAIEYLRTAINFYNKSFSKDTVFLTKMYLRLWEFYFRIGQDENGIEIVRKLILITPTDFEALSRLCWLTISNGDLDLAKDIYKKLEDIKPLTEIETQKLRDCKSTIFKKKIHKRSDSFR